MCLDIDPDSIIHKHLVKKTKSTDFEEHCFAQQEIWHHSKILLSDSPSHNLKMLPSFHISLGAPFQNIKPESITPSNHSTDIACLIGLIVLAPIHISENKNKKSAWVPIDPLHIKIGPKKIKTQLHISLANLTGNPHDSIARPEDYIIDTIKK